jgi:pantetheine-phosphate adenylyltransferase
MALPAHSAGKPHVAIFPGSFDPVTYGHLDVIARGRRLFDRVIIAVGRNPGKEPLFSVEERVGLLTELAGAMERDEPTAAPLSVQSYDGLTVDFARRVGATVLLRGIRNLSDLQSEVQQALTNREIAHLETAFVVAGQSFAYTSSSLIRQLAALGADMGPLRSMVPPQVVGAMAEKKRLGHPVLARLARGNEGE